VWLIGSHLNAARGVPRARGRDIVDLSLPTALQRAGSADVKRVKAIA
jgi:hypothetical protein